MSRAVKVSPVRFVLHDADGSLLGVLSKSGFERADSGDDRPEGRLDWLRGAFGPVRDRWRERRLEKRGADRQRCPELLKIELSVDGVPARQCDVHVHVHGDSSADGRPDIARGSNVEVGGRGGHDSGPRVDAPTTDGGVS